MFSRLRNKKKYPVLFLASILILLGINIFHYHKINLNDNVQTITLFQDGNSVSGKDTKIDNLEFCYVQHLSSNLLDTSFGCIEVFQLNVLSNLVSGTQSDVPQFYYSYTQLRAPPFNSAV